MPSVIFLSYAHKDDQGGLAGITRLKADLEAELGLQAGEDREIWMDRSKLEWGDDWRLHINEALLDSTFLIPILTPRYFKSGECRSELIGFANSAKALGLEELILPIYFVDVEGLGDGTSEDEAVQLAGRFQYVDWRALRTSDPNSAEVRTSVAGLAQRLLSAERSAEAKATPADLSTLDESQTPADDDDGPAALELLAEGEAAVHQLAPDLETISRIVQEVGDLFKDGSTDVAKGDASGHGFAGRLTVARKLATALEPHATTLEQTTSRYVQHVNEVDGMISVMMSHLASAPREEVEAARESVEAIVSMAESARVGLGSSISLADVVRENQKWSKDLRRPLRRIETSLRQFADTLPLFERWEVQGRNVLDDGARGAGSD